MKRGQAKRILRGVYKGQEDGCYGDCCLRGDEKKALVTLVWGPRKAKEVMRDEQDEG
jgi:hypothetical protein